MSSGPMTHVRGSAVGNDVVEHVVLGPLGLLLRLLGAQRAWSKSASESSPGVNSTSTSSTRRSCSCGHVILLVDRAVRIRCPRSCGRCAHGRRPARPRTTPAEAPGPWSTRRRRSSPRSLEGHDVALRREDSVGRVLAVVEAGALDDELSMWCLRLINSDVDLVEATTSGRAGLNTAPRRR